MPDLQSVSDSSSDMPSMVTVSDSSDDDWDEQSEDNDTNTDSEMHLGNGVSHDSSSSPLNAPSEMPPRVPLPSRALDEVFVPSFLASRRSGSISEPLRILLERAVSFQRRVINAVLFVTDAS